MWCSLFRGLICFVLAVPLLAVNIDDKLDSPFATECFKRISIGERLVLYDVGRTIERRRVKDCERDCDTYKCTYFSFGISASGNGTCELSSRREIARRVDSDYDTYQRTKHCMEGRPTGYEQSCYRKFQSGKRLDDRLIRHSLPCDNLQACQHQCSVEQHFECHGFNIRLDDSALGRGICELTSVPSAYLDPARDLHNDPDFDFYEKDLKNTSPNCGYTSEVVSIIPKRNEIQVPHPNEILRDGGFPYKNHMVIGNNWPNGRGMPFDRSQDSLPGYVIIEADRNGPERDGREHPKNRLPHGRSNTPPYPIVPQHFQPGPSDNFHGWNYGGHNSNEHVCFQRQYPSSRLQHALVRASYTMSTVSHCEEMCSAAAFPCMGFTYRYSNLMDKGANCFLTDVSRINPNADLIQDRDCDVYNRMQTCQKAPTFHDTDCFSWAYSDTALSPEVLRLRVSVKSLTKCELECLRATFFTCRSFLYARGSRREAISKENCWLSDWAVRELTPAQLIPSAGSHIYERGSFGRGCEYDGASPPNIGPNPSDVALHRPQQPRQWNRDVWQHFTVRGWPCRRGTQCALNREAGFWSCEVEGGDHRQWDYCCRLEHACGYSEGYNYPWCYVGEAGPDQWRPCSDHFYPSYQHPQQNHQLPNYDDHVSGAWSSEYGPPSSWPISYLYSSPPPNETDYFEPHEHHLPHQNAPSYTHYGNSPKIQFKPTTSSYYPKAIVQKLDMEGMSDSQVPENKPTHEKILNINPRNNYGKKIKDCDTPKHVFESEGGVKNNDSAFPNFIKGSTTAEFTTNIQLVKDTVDTFKINKTKEIVQRIETIIANSTKELEGKNCTEKAQEPLDSKSSEGITYSLIRSQTSPLKDRSNAMSRFWNWGHENYFSNDSNN